MANIQDYLAWRGDVPFSASPFNAVDALVLTELAYTDFSGILGTGKKRIPLKEVQKQFWQAHTEDEVLATPGFTKMSPFLLNGMAAGDRFGGVKMSFYLDQVVAKADMQLSAVTYWLPDGTAFIAFRGTDTTVVGWKEDFNLSYQPETEGQHQAAEYLNRHFASSSFSLRIGGHSKGGNLAVFSSVRAKKAVRDRILTVYDNDGPGFLKPFTESESYREMLPRIISVVPEGSVIGALLHNEARQLVVKSSAFGIMQHDGFTWQVLGKGFVEAEKRSEKSLLIEATLRQWLEGLSDESRRQFINSLFSLFEATGKETFAEILQEKGKSLSSMRKMLENIPREQREAALAVVGRLIRVGGDNLYQDAKRGFRALLDNIASFPDHDRKQEKPS